VETRKLIEAFPKGSPPIQIDILKAIDHYIGLENIYEIDTDKNFTLIMGKTTQIFIVTNSIHAVTLMHIFSYHLDRMLNLLYDVT
jgi:hypothetical protein